MNRQKEAAYREVESLGDEMLEQFGAEGLVEFVEELYRAIKEPGVDSFWQMLTPERKEALILLAGWAVMQILARHRA